ncbi:MAG: translocation/assembly module TamB domain-containing protein [Xanthomonadaceae bacterium]|nr:translocation/assembly module TamB domain-containing protein [Xanthomonadaceae bacterium]
MSRVLRWLLVGFTALTLLLALAWGWLFHSAPGRDFVLARAQAALGDERLRWGTIGGTIGGGLTLDEVLLRLDTLQVEAHQVVVTIRPVSLWRGRLRVQSLTIAGLRLTPLRRTAPTAERAWSAPSVWPLLPLPLRIEITQLRVRELAWLGNPEAPLRADELSAALMLSDRRMTLDALDLTTARGSARGEAELTLGTGSALDARLALTATVADGAPWHAQVSVAGTPNALTLRIAGNAPGEFSLAGEWRPQRDQWRWQAQLRAQGIVPAALGGPPGRFGGELTVDGVDASATLSGVLQRDAQTLAIAPSTLSWHPPRLLLSPLQLGVAGGQARIAGEIDLGEHGPRVALQVQAADLRWGDDAQPTRASGDARVEGWIDGWTLNAQAQLTHAGLVGTLRLAADGDAQRAQLHELSLVTPAGRSQLGGEVRFADALQWQLDGRLSGLDPGWFAPDYPGALAARIRTHGRVRDGAIDAHASIDELSGILRQRKVSGTASIDRRDTTTTADIDLHIGASHVRAVGQLDTHVDARIRLAPLQLADLLPGTQGQLQGELLLRGPRARPLPSGDLQGRALAWGNFRARALRLRAQDGGKDGTHAQLQASELAIDGFDIARLDVELDGHPEQARLTLSAASDALHAELTGNWALHGARQQFDLRSLRLAPMQGAPWQLRQPVRLVGAATWQLPPLCLDSDDGEVCAEGNWPGSIALRARALDLALAQPWLHRDDVQFALSGTLDVDASLRGGGASPLLGSAQVRGGAGSLQLLPATRQPAFAWRALSVETQLDAVRATAHLRLESDADGRLDGRIDMARAGDGALDGELNVDVTQLAWLELFSPDLAAPSGRLRGRFDIGGNRAAPRLSGQLSLQPFAAELPALGIALRESSAHLSAAADGMLTLSALLNTGDGVLKVDGESAVGANAPLTLRLDGERVKISETADVTAWISPSLTVQRADGVLSVRGRIDVPQARIALDKRESRAAARSPDVEVIDPLEPESGDAALPLALDLDLQIGKDVRLSGFGIDGKLGGGLRVTQIPGREPLGTGTVTATGSYERYGKPLEIRHARLTYTRSPLDDPALDIRAQRTVDTQMVGVQIDGTAQRPLTTLISDPALENGETLSWLVLGRPLHAAQQDDSARLDAAAMALGAGGNLLAEQLGARLGLDQAGVAESRALGANTLTVGKNLSPRLYLSYGVSLIGSGQVVALKYLLGGGFDLEIESGLESRGSINWRTER